MGTVELTDPGYLVTSVAEGEVSCPRVADFRIRFHQNVRPVKTVLSLNEFTDHAVRLWRFPSVSYLRPAVG
jgi:hypothetical protein